VGSQHGEIYTLDAALAAAIILLTISTLTMIRMSHVARVHTPPEEQLAALLKDIEFLNALYANDTVRLAAIVNSYIKNPYNLTVYTPEGVKLFSIGQYVEGVAAVAIIPGWNGTLRGRVVSLIVRGSGA